MLAALACAAAFGQAYRPFPGSPVDQRTRATQERVEQIYAAGNFERALFIYEQELAPIGDKYAQYMVGYMHLNAQGVPEDKVEALAWYRLASERGEPLLEDARRELAAELSSADIARSDAIFAGLWKRIGDRALIMDLVRKDVETLKSATGSRISGKQTTGPIMVFRPSGEVLGPVYYEDIRKRLAARMNYLETRVEIDDAALTGEVDQFRKEEEQVRQEIAELADLEKR